MPKEGYNKGVKPSTVSKIKEVPTYLNPLLLESIPLDISPLFIFTDPISLLLKPKFTGQHTQKPMPTNTQLAPTSN